MPIRISCACRARRIARLRCNNAMSCRLVRSASAGTASRSASTLSRRFSAKRGSAARSRPTRHAPRSRCAAGIGLSFWRDRCLGRDLTGEPEVDGDVAVDGDHDRRSRRSLRLRRRSRERHRLADGVAEWRDPEIVLELHEGLGEGLRDGPGTVDRPARRTPYLGGDRPRLEQPHRAVVRDRPLDVLRSAEDRGDRLADSSTRRRRSARVNCGPSFASNSSTLASAFEQVPRPAYLSAHELFGCTVHRGDDAAVGPAGNRIDPEHDATEGRLDQGLDQHCDRLVARAGAFARVEHLLHRDRERIEATNPDHRLELAGHRGVRRVLDHRRAPGDERLVVAGGPRERLLHGGMRIDLGAGVDRVGERRREHDPGQRGEPRSSRRGRARPPSARQRVERRLVLELDQQGLDHSNSLSAVASALWFAASESREPELDQAERAIQCAGRRGGARRSDGAGKHMVVPPEQIRAGREASHDPS